MLWVGLRARWTSLPDDDLRWGFGRAVLASLGTLIFIFYAVIFEYHVATRALFIVPAVIVLAARLVVDRVVSQIIQRRAVMLSP